MRILCFVHFSDTRLPFFEEGEIRGPKIDALTPKNRLFDALANVARCRPDIYPFSLFGG